MKSHELDALLREDAKVRQTVETIGMTQYSFDYVHHNSIGESLNKHERVTLKDGSVLSMAADHLGRMTMDYDGLPAPFYPDSGSYGGAEGKSVLIRHTDLDGNITYHRAFMMYDSWDNGYSDEWIVTQVRSVDWVE